MAGSMGQFKRVKEGGSMSTYHQQMMNLGADNAAAEIAAQADAEIAKLKKGQVITDIRNLCIWYLAEGLAALSRKEHVKAEECFYRATIWHDVAVGETMTEAEIEAIMQPGFDLQAWMDVRLKKEAR